MSTIACVLTFVSIVALADAARAEEETLAHDVYFSLKDNSPQAQKPVKRQKSANVRFNLLPGLLK